MFLEVLAKTMKYFMTVVIPFEIRTWDLPYTEGSLFTAKVLKLF
jgi:hypothetical protein